LIGRSAECAAEAFDSPRLANLANEVRFAQPDAPRVPQKQILKNSRHLSPLRAN